MEKKREPLANKNGRKKPAGGLIRQWIRENFTVVAITSVTTAVVTGASTWYTIYHDRPNLQVSIRAVAPEFRVNDRAPWSTERYKPIIDELFDSGLGFISADYMHQSRILAPGGKQMLTDRMKSLTNQTEAVKIRIPLKIRVANNGRRATTIVTGEFVGRDWGKELWVSQIKEINEHIEPSQAQDLGSRHIVFEGLKQLPDSLQMDIIFEAMIRKVDRVASQMVPPKELKVGLQEIRQGMRIMMSKMQPIMKDITGDKMLDLQEGFSITVRLTDQFGETVSGTTDTIRLSSPVKVTQ